VRRELLGRLSDQLEVIDRGEDVLVLSRAGEPALVCVVNCGTVGAAVVDLGAPLLTSEAAAVADGMLAPGTAAWFRA
jgi:alpha-glucosidase